MPVQSIITISREYGSGGKEIGRRLAAQLEIPFYDNEIITMAASESGIPEKLFVENEEKGAANSLLLSMTVLRDTMAGTFPLSDRLFIAQSHVITQLAEKGSCVIVGRCADYILREREKIINVFIHAPMADRVQRATHEYGVKEDHAAAEVMKIDKRRAAYYDYYSFLKWGQSNHYDLCLNSSIGIDNSVALLESFIAMRERNG